jgi:hypothetical protein
VGIVYTEVHFEGAHPEPEAVRARVAEVLGKPLELVWFPPGFYVVVSTHLGSGTGVGLARRGDTLEMEFQEGARAPELVRQALLALGGTSERIERLGSDTKESRFRFHFAGAPPTPEAICEQVERSGGSIMGGPAPTRGAYDLRPGARLDPATLYFIDSRRIDIESGLWSGFHGTVLEALVSLGGRYESHDRLPQTWWERLLLRPVQYRKRWVPSPPPGSDSSNPPG